MPLTNERGRAQDRAAVVATNIIAVVVDALRNWLRGGLTGSLADTHTQIETLLRDEFADLARRVRGERDVLD